MNSLRRQRRWLVFREVVASVDELQHDFDHLGCIQVVFFFVAGACGTGKCDHAIVEFLIECVRVGSQSGSCVAYIGLRVSTHTFEILRAGAQDTFVEVPASFAAYHGQVGVLF
jgi:hypothetical protein